jgi:phosphohistidine phosphatase
MAAERLYFVQHGLAENKLDNPDRPLTEEGFNQTRNNARQLLALKAPVSHIFHSGKLRAQQTAEVIASVLNVNKIDAIDHLSPNDDPALITQELNETAALYVGHLPHLEKLVSMLITGKEAPAILEFQNSAVVCLNKNEDVYKILWYITPQPATTHNG